MFHFNLSLVDIKTDENHLSILQAWQNIASQQ